MLCGCADEFGNMSSVRYTLNADDTSHVICSVSKDIAAFIMSSKQVDCVVQNANNNHSVFENGSFVLNCQH